MSIRVAAQSAIMLKNKNKKVNSVKTMASAAAEITALNSISVTEHTSSGTAVTMTLKVILVCDVVLKR